MKTIGILLLSILLLTACGDNEEVYQQPIAVGELSIQGQTDYDIEVNKFGTYCRLDDVNRTIVLSIQYQVNTIMLMFNETPSAGKDITETFYGANSLNVGTNPYISSGKVIVKSYDENSVTIQFNRASIKGSHTNKNVIINGTMQFPIRQRS